MRSRCRWNDSHSHYFDLNSGTKQGGIISPKIFSLYIDDLVKRLRKLGVGCHMLLIFLACILFADDLCLIAPTRGAMQQMIQVCESYCKEYCLSFNARKSKSMIFGKTPKDFDPLPLSLNGTKIDYVDEWRYLGTLVKSGKEFSFSPKNDLRSFYCSVNSIISALKKPNEVVQMQILYSVCIPILSYASEVKVFSCKDMLQCNVAVNDSIRRIFSFHRWESTRTLRESLSYPDLYSLFMKRKRNFITNLSIM
jgi:hypothetical protein